MAKQFKPETLCVQAGWTPKKGEPRVLPIYQSTTFKYDTSEQMARLFDLEDSGYFYTRLQNPTNDAVAAKIAAGADIKVDDVIIGVDNKKVSNMADLQEALAKHRPGDKVKVKLMRDKKEKTVEVTLKNEQGTTKIVKDAGMEILGAAFKELPDDLKKQLNLGYGLQVTGVSSGKMSDAGVRKGFIILKANDQPMRKVSDLEEVMKAAVKSPNQVLFLTGVFPSGKRGYFAVDLTQE